MIQYDNVFYDERFVFAKQELKERLELQLGDFGEQLLMTLLGRLSPARYSVALVDHEGADLIISDKKAEKSYAVSVKTWQIGPTENETKVFKNKDQEKLIAFADDFDLIPAVGLIIIPKDFAYIDVYLATLEGLRQLAARDTDPVAGEAVKFVKKGIQINNYSLGTLKCPQHGDGRGYLHYLHNNEWINHIRLDVQNRESFLKELKPTEHVKSSHQTPDLNLSRQLGDFGEYLLVMLLGRVKQYKVARIDHVGADLIATDRKGRKYAISVKTRMGREYTFDENYESQKVKPKHELGKLQDFADKYPGMIPAVACIFIDKEYRDADIYISTLEHWLELGYAGKYGAIKASRATQFWTSSEPFTLEHWREELSQLTINMTDEKKRQKVNEEALMF